MINKLLKNLLILMVIIVFSNSVYALSYTFKLTENEIQTKISERQPIRYETKLLTIVLPKPVVKLLSETNEILVQSPVEIEGFPNKGYASIKGVLRYDAKKGEFFLDKVKVEEFMFDGLSNKYQMLAKNILQKLADEMLSKHPVYKFNESLTNKLAKSILISIKVEKNYLLIELGY